MAVISCGRDNEYGHPTPSTLAALRDSPGLSLYRTDEDGRVVLESDGRRISVEFTIVLLRNEAQAVAGTVAVMRDVTKRLEELRELKRRLAQAGASS